MAPGAELQNRSRKVFTTKSTKNTKFGFCNRFEKGVIARSRRLMYQSRF
jgi:hypothetical protein